MNENFSLDEINQLSISDKEIYLQRKDEQIHLNNNILMIHEEMNNEDLRTAYLEEISSDSELFDDY